MSKQELGMILAEIVLNVELSQNKLSTNSQRKE